MRRLIGFMKTLYNKVSQLFQRYKVTNKRLHQIIDSKTAFKATLFSIIMSLFIISLPIAIIINMFIFTKLTIFLSILIVILILLWVYLYYIFYFILLRNYDDRVNDLNTTYIFWVETSLINFILLWISIVVLSILI